jgi:hypothetical protein
MYMSYQARHGAMWRRVEGIVQEAHGLAANAPALAADLYKAALSWCDSERPNFTPQDSWNALCLVPASFLTQALDSPDGAAGRLLAHAQPTLGFVKSMPQGFDALPVSTIDALETLGLRYGSLGHPTHLAATVWLATGSVLARDAWCGTSDPVKGVWIYWTTAGCWLPQAGLHPKTARVVLDLITAYTDPTSPYTDNKRPKSTKIADLRVALAFAVLGAGELDLIPGMQAGCFTQEWEGIISSLVDARTAHAQVRAAHLRDSLLDARSILLLPRPPQTLDDVLKRTA